MPGIDSNTLLLLRGDSLTDLSPMGKQITNVGVAVNQPESHFAGIGSFYFDGSAHLQIPPSVFDGGDFTVDWWEKAESGAGTRFSTIEDGTPGGLVIGYKNTMLYVGSVKGSWDVFPGVNAMDVTPSEWVHWALVRNGSSFKTYKNGLEFWGNASSKAVYSPLSAKWEVGKIGSSTETDAFKGYIQEFRISNVARWTSDFEPPTEPYSPENLIEVTLTRENDRTTFCRQITYNPKGEYNSRRDGAIVSGMPVAGNPVEALPVGSKIALTDPTKLSPNEVGYIVAGEDVENLLLTTDAHAVTSSFNARNTNVQKFFDDMTEKARAVCTLVRAGMTKDELEGGLPYMTDQSKRAFFALYWTETVYGGSNMWVARADGSFAPVADLDNGRNRYLRPLLSIPKGTLVSAEPNAAGAYELV